MKFIDLIVPFAKNEEITFDEPGDLTKFLNSGDYELETIHINPNAICAFNKSSDDRVLTLRLVDGTTWNPLIGFNEFKKMMEEL